MDNAAASTYRLCDILNKRPALTVCEVGTSATTKTVFINLLLESVQECRCMIHTNVDTPIQGLASLVNVDSSHRFAISFDSNSWSQSTNHLHLQIGNPTYIHYYVENPLAGQPGCLMISAQEENITITCYARPNLMERRISVGGSSSEETKPRESPIVLGLSATLGLVCIAAVVIVVFKYRRRNTNVKPRTSGVYDIPDDDGVYSIEDNPASNDNHTVLRRGSSTNANSDSSNVTGEANRYATINDDDETAEDKGQDDNLVETRHCHRSDKIYNTRTAMSSEEACVEVYSDCNNPNDTQVRNWASADCTVERGTMYITCVDRDSTILPGVNYDGHIAQRSVTHEESEHHTTHHLGESQGYLHVVYEH